MLRCRRVIFAELRGIFGVVFAGIPPAGAVRIPAALRRVHALVEPP